MFIILTQDNQSTLSSFSLFLSFVINSPVDLFLCRNSFVVFIFMDYMDSVL